MKKSVLIILTIFSLPAFSQEMEPKETEVWEPVPAIVTPGKATEAPSDAIILFDGKNLDQWQNPQFKGEPGTEKEVAANLSKLDKNFKHQPAGWVVENGAMVVKPGNGAIETKEKFGNFQLHIEWLTPKMEGKSDQGYSNSGIFLMSLYELQVLNSYENKTYSNGQAGSIYKQHIPLVNASNPPDEWQAYDVVFTAPVFDESGKLVSPAYVTVFHNGVLIQNHAELKGPTVYIGKPFYIAHPEQMPLRLQDHGDKVRFRNIWIRNL